MRGGRSQSMPSDLMGGDLMGGGMEDLMGGMGGGAAPPRRNQGPKVNMKEPEGGGDRNFFAARREAEKQAAIDAKVNALKEAKQTEESNRDKEQMLEKQVKARVQQWTKEKKNLRALLASLHEIAPPCSWNPVTLAQLIDPAMVKKSYRKALLAVHPDKQDSGDVEKKVLAQHVFDALRDAWNIFEKTG